jgi:hypothetical protein
MSRRRTFLRRACFVVGLLAAGSIQVPAGTKTTPVPTPVPTPWAPPSPTPAPGATPTPVTAPSPTPCNVDALCIELRPLMGSNAVGQVFCCNGIPFFCINMDHYYSTPGGRWAAEQIEDCIRAHEQEHLDGGHGDCPPSGIGPAEIEPSEKALAECAAYMAQISCLQQKSCDGKCETIPVESDRIWCEVTEQLCNDQLANERTRVTEQIRRYCGQLGPTPAPSPTPSPTTDPKGTPP